MGPKKQLTSSTPAVMKPLATFGTSSDMSAPSTITESSFGNGEVVVKPPVLTKLTTLDLVFQAIETIGVPRKGASYLAIQKWIVSSKGNVAINRLKANLKKAIVKALDSGILKRPTISKNVTGLRGYFILNKDAIVEKKKAEIKTAKKLVEKAKVAKAKTVVVPETKTAAVPKTKTAAAPKTKPVAASKTKPVAASKTKPVAASKTKPVAASKNKPTTAPKSKPAAAPKSKPAAAPKSKPAAAPKSKPEVAPIAKAAVAQKTKAASESGETTKPKQKTKAAKPDNGEAGPSKKPKVKAAVKPRPGKSPVSKSKPKPTAEKRKSEKDMSTDEPQAAKSRESGVRFSTEEDLSSEEDLPQRKAPSNLTKPTKEGRQRKLYNVDSPTNISRKDLSDTELNVKPDIRKSLKSYASDTELEVTYNRKKAKVAKVVKKLDIKKHVKETSKTGNSHENVKKRKGKNSTADDVFE